jgi:hypothetical protein
LYKSFATAALSNKRERQNRDEIDQVSKSLLEMPSFTAPSEETQVTKDLLIKSSIKLQMQRQRLNKNASKML